MPESPHVPPAAEGTGTGSSAAKGAAPAGRLISLDAYRGAIMLLMASSGLGLARIAAQFPASESWQFLALQTEHAPWTGCRLWDLIQPAFMFMVGVAVPWSVANRRARGEGFGRLLAHAWWRSLVLVLLAVGVTSAWSKQTDWVFTNVLAQIGLGYPFLFLLAFARPRAQWLAVGCILAGYWLLFVLYPLPPAGFEWRPAGVPADWPLLTGLEAHWQKGANFAAAFDRWFLNLFPREQPFLFNSGGYQTLNFVPSLATMIFGLLAGNVLRGEGPIAAKLQRLLVAGMAGCILGLAISLAGWCPLVKRLWTPSWALYSGGWVTLILAFCVAAVEWQGWKRWTFPFVVAGQNPITLYCLWQLSGGFVRENLQRHLGSQVFDLLGKTWAPALERAFILLAFWLVLLWMHRRRILVRI